MNNEKKTPNLNNLDMTIQTMANPELSPEICYREIRARLDKRIKISDSLSEGLGHLSFDILKGKVVIGEVQIDIEEGEIIVAHMDEEILYETWYPEEGGTISVTEIAENAVDLIEESYESLVDIHTNLKKVHELISKINGLLDDINLDDYIEIHYRYQDFDV